MAVNSILPVSQNTYDFTLHMDHGIFYWNEPGTEELT